MTTKTQDITLLVKKYGPGYVAKSEKTGKVIAHHKNIGILIEKVKDKKNIIISWLPEPNARYVFKISL